MTDPPLRTVRQAIRDVMGEIDHIAKSQTNHQQHFNFRGIDDVKNVVDPLFRKHGLSCDQLEILKEERTYYETKSGTAMTNFTTTIKFCWTGPDESEKFSVAIGESADSGDKAVSKAQSVAKRIALIDVLNIPVAPSRDPDADSHERSGPPARQPSGRDWLAEAKTIADGGLVLVATDLKAAMAAKENLLLHRAECKDFGELTPLLDRQITEQGKKLAAAIAAAGSTEAGRALQASVAAAKVRNARVTRNTRGGS